MPCPRHPLEFSSIDLLVPLIAILKFAAIRRTKDSLIDGVPILTLPVKTVEVVEQDFTAEERAVSWFQPTRNQSTAPHIDQLVFLQIYDAVERRAIVKFNKFLARGTGM